VSSTCSSTSATGPSTRRSASADVARRSPRVEVPREHLPSGLWREAGRRLRRNPAIIGASFVACSCLVAPSRLARARPPNEQNLSARRTGVARAVVGPSDGSRRTGATSFARDVRARYSLVIGVVSVAVASRRHVPRRVRGFRGFTDSIAMRGMDIMPRDPDSRWRSES
jgi:hypothetical protein